MSKWKKSLLIFAGIVLLAFVVSIFVVREAWREEIAMCTFVFLCIPAFLTTTVMMFRKKWRQNVYITSSIFLGCFTIFYMFCGPGIHFKMNPEKQAIRLVKKIINKSDRDHLLIANIDKNYDTIYGEGYLVSAKDNTKLTRYNDIIEMNEDSVVFYVRFDNRNIENRWFHSPEVVWTRNFERKQTDDDLYILKKMRYFDYINKPFQNYDGVFSSIICEWNDEVTLNSDVLDYLRREFCFSAIKGRVVRYTIYDGKITYEIDNRDKTETFTNPKILFYFDNDINKREIVTFNEVIKPGKIYRKDFLLEVGKNCKVVHYIHTPEEFNDDEWLIQYLKKQPESEWNKYNHYERYYKGYYKDQPINVLFDK